jgi:hypothetical protein
MVSDNVISFEQSVDNVRRRVLDARLVPVVAAVRGKLEEILPKLMQDLFEHLDDDLYELADKAASDALQTDYFEALRALRKLRTVIERAFVDGRLRNFDEFWEKRPLESKPKPSSDSFEDSQMELVDDTELEEMLAISSMVSKSDNRFHRDLFALNKRFAAILGGSEIDNAANPIGPKALATGFASALSDWQGKTAIKLLVFKLFDRYVMSFIGGLYDDINDVLVHAGILPKIVQQVRRNPVAPSVQRSRNPQQQEKTTPTDESDGDQAFEGSDVLGLLERLLSVRRGRNGNGQRWSFSDGAAPHLPEVSTNDLLNALSGVQQNALQAAPADLSEVERLQLDLVDLVGRELELGPEGNRTRRLGHADQDMLDIMEMVFDFILGDDNLPEAMKALLGRLQIPLLKVAVLDRNFFANRKHPARVLLNTLARAGVAWTDDGDRSPTSAYGRIETAVTRILSEFRDDPGLFEEVLDEFNQYLDRERRSAEVAEERVGQVKRGQETLELARVRVAELIAAHLKRYQVPGCVIPEAVAQLLNEPWRDVLLLAYLRDGEDSAAWQGASELTDLVLWSVQPKSDQADRQKLLKLIPDLLKRLREGLVNISFDHHRSSVLFKELQACHIAALRGASVAPANPQSLPPEPPKELHKKPSVAAEQDNYQQAAEALQVGQWVEWKRDDDNWVRGKLSWRSEVTGNCIFVSRKGVKLEEMTLAEIAARLRANQARVLQDLEKPLMDRALNAMLEALQRTSPEPQSA